MGRKCTRKDVARLANVSESTVSYVLSGKKRMSKRVEAQIFEAAKTLGYAVNHSAHVMSSGKSETICYLTESSMVYNQYMIICGIEKRAAEKDYWLNIKTSIDLMNFEKTMQSMISRNVEGIILSINPIYLEKECVDRLTEHGIKILLSIGTFDKEYDLSVISPDYWEGMEQTVAHLYSLGHRNIVHVALNGEHGKYDTRCPGFLKAIRKRELEEKIVYTDYNIDCEKELAEQAVDKILNQMPETTAIVFLNETMAIYGMRRLVERGYKVPEDVSIVGVDEGLLGAIAEPKVSTLRFDNFSFGAKSFDVLYEYIRTGIKTKTLFPLEFVEKGSTGQARR